MKTFVFVCLFALFFVISIVHPKLRNKYRGNDDNLLENSENESSDGGPDVNWSFNAKKKFGKKPSNGSRNGTKGKNKPQGHATSFSSHKSFSSSTINGVTKQSGFDSEEFKTQEGNQAEKIRRYAEQFNKKESKKIRIAKLAKTASTNVKGEEKFFPKNPIVKNLTKAEEKSFKKDLFNIGKDFEGFVKRGKPTNKSKYGKFLDERKKASKASREM